MRLQTWCETDTRDVAKVFAIARQNDAFFVILILMYAFIVLVLF